MFVERSNLNVLQLAFKSTLLGGGGNKLNSMQFVVM